MLSPAVQKKNLVLSFHSITIIYLNITYQSILASLHRQKDRMKYRKFKKKKTRTKKIEHTIIKIELKYEFSFLILATICTVHNCEHSVSPSLYFTSYYMLYFLSHTIYNIISMR